MKIPKKISPDRIKDSIVEIKYNSSFPFEVVIGILYNQFDESYKYSNRPPVEKNQFPSEFLQPEVNNQFQFVLGNQYLFYNDKVIVELRPNSLIFNCLNGYIGWQDYFLEIKNVIQNIIKTSVIDSFNRVGTRYISHYPDVDFKKCVKFEFSFGLPQVSSNTFAFTSEFIFENLKVILGLRYNNLAIPNDTFNGIKPVSIIDLDVIDDAINLKVTELELLFNKIDFLHTSEKTIFFSLLKEDFVKSLNPIY